MGKPVTYGQTKQGAQEAKGDMGKMMMLQALMGMFNNQGQGQEGQQQPSNPIINGFQQKAPMQLTGFPSMGNAGSYSGIINQALKRYQGGM
jgi:hypothetical protein